MCYWSDKQFYYPISSWERIQSLLIPRGVKTALFGFYFWVFSVLLIATHFTIIAIYLLLVSTFSLTSVFETVPSYRGMFWNRLQTLTIILSEDRKHGCTPSLVLLGTLANWPTFALYFTLMTSFVVSIKGTKKVILWVSGRYVRKR